MPEVLLCDFDGHLASDGMARVRMALNRHDWVVYAKTPLAGPEAVLDCLSRYTHRAAVSNERILSRDAAGVRLRVRADNQGGKRVITIDGPEFMGRFLQHGLPSGFKRILPLLPAQPSAQNRAHGHRACRAGHAGRKRPSPRGRRRVPQARGADRRHALPALRPGQVADLGDRAPGQRHQRHQRHQRCKRRKRRKRQSAGAVPGAAMIAGRPRCTPFPAIAGPHRPGNARTRLGQAKQTHWPTTGKPRRCAARRLNRATLAAAAVQRGESAHAGASTLPKPPR